MKLMTSWRNKIKRTIKMCLTKNSMTPTLKWTRSVLYPKLTPLQKMRTTSLPFSNNIQNQEQTKEENQMAMTYWQRKMLFKPLRISSASGTTSPSRMPRNTSTRGSRRPGTRWMSIIKDSLTFLRHSSLRDNSWEHSALWLIDFSFHKLI